MALSLTTNWKTAMGRDDCRPVILAQIDTSVSVSYKFVDSMQSQISGAYPSLASVTPIGVKVDPFARSLSVGQMTATFLDDGVIRELAAANRLKNKRITFKLGEDSLSESDYASYFKGVIYDIVGDEGQVHLICSDALSIALDTMYYGRWTNKHPLQVITTILTGVGVPSELIDSTAFTPSGYSTISHFCLGPRERDAALNVGANKAGFKAGEAVNAIAQMLMGSVYVAEDGKVTFKRYDATTSAVAGFTSDDIYEGTFKHESSYENLVNEIAITSSLQPEALAESPNFVTDDDTSKANYAYPGTSTFVASRRLDWPYAGPIANTAISSVGAVNISLGDQTVHGFCGTRAGYPSGSQPADAKISAGRPLYIKVESEIIRCTSALTFNGNYGVFQPYTAAGIPTSTQQVPIQATLPSGGVTRAMFGTVATTHTGAYGTPLPAVDITMAVEWATDAIARFANGCPIVAFETSLRRHDIQIGDIVTITDDVFLYYGMNGVTSSTKWEVVGKEVDPHKGAIAFTCAKGA